MANISSRYLRAAVRSRTVTGATSVGGTTSTLVGVYPDGSVRYTDRTGRLVTIKGSGAEALRGDMIGQPSSRGIQDDAYSALFDLVDVLIARA